jgi:hypothetical protein
MSVQEPQSAGHDRRDEFVRFQAGFSGETGAALRFRDTTVRNRTRLRSLDWAQARFAT